jgi:hypothetical protein
MSNQAVPAANRARTWMRKGAMRAAWVHAGIAFLLGAVFGLFLRNIAIAALFTQGLLIVAAALVVILGAVGFGALGRAFNGRRAGWWLAITVIIWAPAVLGTAFIVFSDNGLFSQLNPTAPLVGGVAGAVVALLSHAGPPRVIGIIALLAAASVLTASILITF